jgi:hypothetical protein
MKGILAFLVAMLGLMLAACGGPAASVAPTLSASNDAGAASAGWQSIPLRNARTGETFTFADFAGRTVYVHPMARW